VVWLEAVHRFHDAIQVIIRACALRHRGLDQQLFVAQGRTKVDPGLSIPLIMASLDSSKFRYNTFSPRRQAACVNVLASVVCPCRCCPK